MANNALLELAMAKAKRNDQPVKVDAEVLRKARIVAAYRDVSLAEYLSDRLKPLVDADLAEHQRVESASTTAATRKKKDKDTD